MQEQSEKICSTYHHIDNGGVEFVFDIITSPTDTWINPRITINTSYFGYPSISASIRDCGFLTPEALEEIGQKFIEFAGAVRQRYADIAAQETK